MGNDGGDIPRRKQLVKEKKKEEFATAESIAMGRARYCNLTKRDLKEPLAICRLGCIYNYENILTALVQKTLSEKYQYIKKLSDIKKIQIERASADSLNYIACPITKLEYNGFNRFVGLWTCGHVMSRKAFKEVKFEEKVEEVVAEKKDEGAESSKSSDVKKQSSGKKCIICEMEYEDSDVIDLNLLANEMEKRRKELIEKKNKRKPVKEQTVELGEPSKKLKMDSVYLNGIDRLGGEFRDVIRERSKFRELFEKKN